ncbi:MAG: EFR1 family ferrodoxin [Cystobacterineae bacterium]|nr:EFR1 family ferrodoxin [Cystobacterineae bacterium]
MVDNATSIKKLKIFYFSGTGNAKQISSWFSEIAIKKGIEAQLFNIGKMKKDEIDTLAAGFSDELIVIISPVHGFSFPRIMLKFIEHFPKGSNNIVLMNTRGGLRIGRWVTPGLSGAAFLLSSWVLRRKGYKIVGQIPFDMPSNWISFHPALTDKASKFICEKNHKKVEKHAEKIFSGQVDFLAYRDLVQDILVLPIAFLYYYVGRFFIAKTFYATKACDHCGVCERECPVRAIKNSKSLPFWTFKCESCMRCMNICPKRAIENNTWLLGVLTYVFLSFFSAVFFYFVRESTLSTGVELLFSSIIFFVLLFLFYRAQYFLLKNKFFGKLIALTTLTYYKFWGRYYFNKKSRR